VTQQDEPALSSFVPADIWYRCPLSREQIAEVFDTVGFPLKIDPDEREALLLTVAKSLDHAYPHVLYLRQLMPERMAKKYGEAFVKFLAASTGAGVWEFRDSPPKIPMDWLKAHLAWFAPRIGQDRGKGRPENVGDADFFSIMLAVYCLAFARAPSPSPTGPTFRFLRAVCDGLERASTTPKFPSIPDATLIAGVRAHRGKMMSDLVAGIFALCKQAAGPPV